MFRKINMYGKPSMAHGLSDLKFWTSMDQNTIVNPFLEILTISKFMQNCRKIMMLVSNFLFVPDNIRYSIKTI